MAKRFTRNIENVNNIKELPLDLTLQNDLVSDKQDVYVRNKEGYHCLTDNVKDINGFKPESGSNSLSLIYVENITSDDESIIIKGNDKNNTQVNLSLNKEQLKQVVTEIVKENTPTPTPYFIKGAGGNFIQLYVHGDYEKLGYTAEFSTQYQPLEPEFINFDESTNQTMLSFNYGDDPIDGSQITLKNANGNIIYNYRFVFPNLANQNANDWSHIEGSEYLFSQINNIVQELQNHTVQLNDLETRLAKLESK